MIGFVVALPAMLLAGGALSCRWLPRPARAWAPGFVIGATGLAGLASMGLLAASLVGPTRSWRLPLSGWEAPGIREVVALDVDALAAFCLLLIALVAFGASLRLVDGLASAEELAGPLWVAAAAALFVSAGRVPLGLAVTWILLDLALFLGARSGVAGLLTGQAGFLCALMGLLALPAGSELLAPPQLWVAQAERLQAWLLLASAVRMGLYPLWWSIPRSDAAAPWRAAVVRLAPMVAGGYLFLRAMEVSRPGEALAAGALLPLALAFLAAAALAWLSRGAVEALDWRMVVQAALVLLAIRAGGPQFRGLGLVLLLNVVLAGLVLYLTADVARRREVVIARRVADAALVGIPLTLGFQGRWLLYRELLDPLPLVLLLLAVGTALAWRPRGTGGLPFIPALGRHRAAVGLAVLAAALLVALGLMPELLGPVLVAVTASEPPVAWREVLTTLAAPVSLARGLVLAAAILVPPVLGELARHAPLPRDPAALAQRSVARRLLRLTGLAGASAAGLVSAGAALQRASGLIEGRRARMWTFLAVIVVALVSLRPPAPPTPLLVPGLAAWLLLGAALAASSALLLGSRPGLTLAALAGAYAVTALALAWGGHLAVALIRGMVGGLVVAILALAVAEMPIDRHVARAAQRLRSLPGPAAGGPGRAVVAGAFAVAVVVVLGIQSTSFPTRMPPEILHPSLVLAAAGVLAALTARSALRLVCGVLLALVGFELAYAWLDPGLLIAAGLAVFQLMFAVVASYYVGLAARPEPVA